MTSIELLKQDLDAELKLGTKMIVNWDMYIEMHKQEIIDAYVKGREEHYLDWYPQKHSEQYYQETFVSKGSDEAELPKHPSVISENGNELLFDKEGNLIKELPKQETLYTEEQVRDIVLKFAEERTFLRQGIAIKWVKDYFQSLKQPKKD
jgi:hypothetical protein